MVIPDAPKTTFIDATETEITISFEALSDTSYQYVLEWKPQQAPSWDNSDVVKSKVLTHGGKVTAEPLEPGQTYCVRLTVIHTASGERGTPGKEMILDTEQVGCGPSAESKKSCCIIS